MPQAHSRGGQRAECRRHREIEQQLQQVEKELWRLHRSALRLLNALRLGDEALGHASKTGDHHEGYAGDAPAHIAAATLEVPSGDSQAGDRDDRSDDVASPVHDVEDRALDRGRLLALDGLAELWETFPGSGLSPRMARARLPIRMRPNANWRATRTQLIWSGRWMTSVEVGADAWERRQKVSAVLIRFLSWTRLLWASVSSERMGRNRNSVK